ncbi:MAG: beta-lactamase family protein, partial [Spirochaetia bacterium]|nr:beta-lactamase family protein [Spirochaetia bacterium]
MLLNRKSFFMKFAKTVFGILVIIVFAVAVLTVVELSSMYRTHHMDEISFDPSPPDHWPSPNWTPSSPEEQGMDSQKLIEMVERYRQEHAQNNEIFIDSISVFRNGYLVADVYFNPLFPQDTEHIINSCTKSIMSVLIGIAIDRGFIKNVDVPVYQLLNCPSCRFTDKRGDALTLKHLLTMQTGLKSRDSYLYMWEGLFQMQTSDDWVGYILDRPFEADPGSRFEYSNMASFLLSAVITRSTGMDTLSFAKKYLFEPLGIRSVTWVKSPQGIYQGFARMWLKPHDMGKIGQLYLQKGVWKDRRIVSQNWVEESIMAHSFPEQYRFFYDESGSIDFGKSGSVWTMTNLARPLSDGYGYQWWLDESGIIAAIGVGGQFIIVIPEKNMVVAVTSKLKGEHTFFPVKLLKEYII